MRLPRRIIFAYLAILFSSLLTTAHVVLAQAAVRQAANPPAEWGDAVRAFVDKIAYAIGSSRLISLEVQNISSLSGRETNALQQQLQSALKTAGFQPATEPLAEVRLRVTLSESSNGYLWIGEIHSRLGDQVVMMSVDVSSAMALMPKPVPILRENLLLSLPSPILDFALVQTAGDDSSQSLLLLEPDEVGIFKQRGGTWAKQASAPIPRSRPWPRDLRGKIDISGTGDFKVFLPGVSCDGTSQLKLNMNCREEANAAWPMGDQTEVPIAADRNYFGARADGAGSGWPSAYSIASKVSEDPSLRIFTELNGSAQLFEGAQYPAATFSGWGDDIASIAAGCGDAWNVLATGRGDWTKPDHIQAYEITGRQATAAGQPFEFSGPVLALWPSDDGKSARAVSRNSQTGMYEASIISLTCGN